MSQPRSAEAVPSGAVTAQRAAGPALAPRHRRVALLLIVLVAVLAVLALTGPRVTDEARSGAAYGLLGRVAALDQQVTGLAMLARTWATPARVWAGYPWPNWAASRRTPAAR